MSDKKPTAADRPQFRRDVADMIDKLDVQVAEIEPSMVVLCSRAEDFDPAHNVLWELEANKSAVRSDVHCFVCKHTLAMSNHAYARYLAFDKKPRTCCVHCVGSLTE